MECEQVREQIALYAAGALDADEHAQVEQHLAGCDRCRRQANEYAEAVTTLPQALAAVSPHRLPPTLKSRVLQAVTESPVAPASRAHDDTAHAGDAVPPAQPRAAPMNGQPAHVTLTSPRHRSLRWRPRAIGTIAAAIVAVLALAWGVQLNAALARERALRAEYAQLVSQQQELVIEVIDSPKTEKAILRSTQPGSNAYGKLFTRPDLPHVVVMAARLPQPPAGQVYQVWLTRDGQMQLVGELALNQGFGVLVFDADRPGPVYQAAQVTLQPRGGTAPSGSPILQWQAPQ
jgi:anti-sigma factor RsiW